MSVSRTRNILGSIILSSLALPVLAQTPADLPGNREASFIAEGPPPVISAPVFSGLAAATPAALATAMPPLASEPLPLPSAAPTPAPPAATPPALKSPPVSSAPPPVVPPPVAAAGPAMPPPILSSPPQATAVSPTPPPPTEANSESIGIPAADMLGTTMWKGTSRAVAEKLISIAALTTSPVLNDLMQRLLMTSATPPEGVGEATQSLTAMRIEKLIAFGDADTAWSLAKHADPKLVDDVTFHFAAEEELASDTEEICNTLGTFAKPRATADWRKSITVCALRIKDKKLAQDGLDLLAKDSVPGDPFLDVATRNVMNEGKSLPHQLTPLTPPLLALLRLTNLPLPAELYAHPDYALAPALVRATVKQDTAQLGLAERAAARGLISSATLETAYQAVSFPAQALAAPMAASESGIRLRALLYQAAQSAKGSSDRIAYAVQFVQSAPADLLNGANSVAADMLGLIPADGVEAANAVAVAYIYMIAGRGDHALDWLRLARRNPASAPQLQNLWPQFTLAGLEAESDYDNDFSKWLDAALVPADPQADMRAARDNTDAQMLLLEAAGFSVPDSAWTRLVAADRNEKHTAFSPVLFARLQAASNAGRRAETVLLATALAGDGDISLPAAVAITHGLRGAGLKSESARFAQQMIALMTAKPN